MIRRYKVIEFSFYFILSLLIFGILSFFPMALIQYIAIFMLGFMLRFFLSRKNSRIDMDNRNRFSVTKMIHQMDNFIGKIKIQIIRYILRVLSPYLFIASIAYIFNSDTPSYIALVGSICFDISMITLGKFEYQHQ